MSDVAASPAPGINTVLDPRTVPIDRESADRLASQGLGLALVDTADVGAFGAWVEAEARGFLDSAQSDAQRRRAVERTAWRRTTGVYDGDEPLPVATSQSWIAELSLPGGVTVPAWGISGVSVAATHRRRGIARAMLEAELRAASAAGLPIAMLTVSEATLYRRYGFGPAADVTTWVIDTARARWRTPDERAGSTAGGGTVRFVAPAEVRDEVAALHERTRIDRPGDVPVWPLRWDLLLGIEGDDEAARRAIRTVRYRDAAGETRGVAVFTIDEHEDFTRHSLDLKHLNADGAEAYAALWRFLLEIDLVQTVTARLRSVDEPLRWMIDDTRGVSVTRSDHQWLRVLDAVAALEARRYAAPGRFGLVIDDPLGFADGSVLLEVDAASAGTARRVEFVPDDVPGLALPVDALGTLLLGGVSAATLVAAGRIRETRPGSADAVDDAFRSRRTPHLGFWY